MIFKTTFDIFSISGAILAFAGGYFLVRSIYGSTPHQIAAMSGTYLGSNKHLELAFVEQKIDTIIGWGLTFFGSALSMTSSFLMFEVKSLCNVAFISIGIALIAIFGGHLLVKFLKKKIFLKTRAISFTHHVISYLEPHNAYQFDAKMLIEDAKRYEISALLNDKLNDYQNLANILKFSDATPGANRILELEGIKNGKK